MGNRVGAFFSERLDIDIDELCHMCARAPTRTTRTRCGEKPKSRAYYNFLYRSSAIYPKNGVFLSEYPYIERRKFIKNFFFRGLEEGNLRGTCVRSFWQYLKIDFHYYIFEFDDSKFEIHLELEIDWEGKKGGIVEVNPE